MGGRRRPRIIVAIVVGVAVVLGGLAAAWASGLLLHDTSRPASVERALARFRARAEIPRPLEGVYLYTTSGGESLDALGGAHHGYPATTPLTAVRVACGLRLRWDALEERSTAWTLCTTPLGVELRVSDETHTFFGRRDRTVYTCTGSVLRPVEAGSDSFRCRSERGGETGVLRVVGRSRIDVGGERLQALHVRTAARVTGGDSGTETVDWWLGPDAAVPLRIVLSSRTSRKLFLGRVHYREDADLRLASTEPLR